MTLADRLQAKGRRHTELRVLVDVEAAGAAAAQLAAATQLAATAELRGDSQEDADAELAAAQAAFDACHEIVRFDALDPDDYEALLGQYVDDESGEIDHWSALPALAAACAVDESLRTPEWWAEQLAPGTTTWSHGERALLLTTLVTLNDAVPRPGPGKG